MDPTRCVHLSRSLTVLSCNFFVAFPKRKLFSTLESHWSDNRGRVLQQIRSFMNWSIRSSIFFGLGSQKIYVYHRCMFMWKIPGYGKTLKRHRERDSSMDTKYRPRSDDTHEFDRTVRPSPFCRLLHGRRGGDAAATTVARRSYPPPRRRRSDRDMGWLMRQEDHGER